jgi:hypothetical protein
VQRTTMGPTPSRLTDAHQTLVMDASVALNLLGSGQPSQLLRALGRRVVLVDLVRSEIQRDPATGKPAAPILDALVAEGLLAEATLSGLAYGEFLGLAGATPPNDLGDGEAATIAHAEEIGGTALLDDGKAVRIALARPSGVRVLSTLDLFSAPLGESLPDIELAELVFRSLRTARMRVAPEFRSWVAALIGEERVSQCSSLAGYQRSRGPLDGVAHRAR